MLEISIVSIVFFLIDIIIFQETARKDYKIHFYREFFVGKKSPFLVPTTNGERSSVFANQYIRWSVSIRARG